MSEVNEHAPGTWCWPELASTDSANAKRFYGDLFGWKAEDAPEASGMIYTLLKKNGLEVAALYQMSDEQKGVPPHWNNYVAVASADEVVMKAAELGGKVVLGAFDVMDIGRMALIEDRQGARFCVWQAKKHVGARLVLESGALGWVELLTTDESDAKSFYTRLFGWSAEGMTMPTHTYTVFKKAGVNVAGMMQITPAMGQARPHWLTYFLVDDCDSTARKTKADGGTVLVQPTDIPNIGRFAVLRDPQEATFAVIKPVPR